MFSCYDIRQKIPLMISGLAAWPLEKRMGIFELGIQIWQWGATCKLHVIGEVLMKWFVLLGLTRYSGQAWILELEIGIVTADWSCIMDIIQNMIAKLEFSKLVTCIGIKSKNEEIDRSHALKSCSCWYLISTNLKMLRYGRFMWYSEILGPQHPPMFSQNKTILAWCKYPKLMPPFHMKYNRTLWILASSELGVLYIGTKEQLRFLHS